jgi:hypothetical protein
MAAVPRERRKRALRGEDGVPFAADVHPSGDLASPSTLSGHSTDTFTVLTLD